MALFPSKVSNGVLVALSFLVLCLLVLQEAYDCVPGHGCFCAEAGDSGKVLAGLNKEKVVNGNSAYGSASSNSRNRESLIAWELRTVPSGPDPLHHNGGSPKKPRTP